MKNYTTPEFGWPHYKHPGSNVVSVFSASGLKSPILRKARSVFPAHMVLFVEFSTLEELHGDSEGVDIVQLPEVNGHEQNTQEDTEGLDQE